MKQKFISLVLVFSMIFSVGFATMEEAHAGNAMMWDDNGDICIFLPGTSAKRWVDQLEAKKHELAGYNLLFDIAAIRFPILASAPIFGNTAQWVAEGWIMKARQKMNSNGLVIRVTKSWFGGVSFEFERGRTINEVAKIYGKLIYL